MTEVRPPSSIAPQYSDDRSLQSDRRGTFRAMVEALVSLFIAVLIFRTFAAEGYMISTGSMAPCLLGFHKRIVCPTCQYTFPFGTAYDTDEDPESTSVSPGRTRAVCPNCGQRGIDVTEVPRNHGDQLLVNKQAFLYRSPERWDVIVFRNPARPTEAYVKRAIGLPGERIQIISGDVVINGQTARKSYRQQISSRIMVHNHDFQPIDDEGYQPHWQVVEPDATSGETKPLSWTASKKSFAYRGGEVRRPDKDPVAWVEYHHWVRAGGLHETAVPLAQWPDDVDVSQVPPAGLRYDPRKGEFGVTGALPRDVAQRMLELSNDEAFRNAVSDLYEASHIAPITDECSYNPPEEAGNPVPVRDLMFSAHVAVQGGSGEFVIEMTNGEDVFAAVFDVIRREIHLYAEPLAEGATLNSQSSSRGPQSEAIASAPWPKSLGGEGSLIEFSIIDKQVLLAIDGAPVMAPWPFELAAGIQPPRFPVRFGARGIDIKVSHLSLYRDVYYTDTRSRHAVNRPLELRDDEFFVLGDNSPVSHDSRRWDEPGVQRSLLIGKPFLVHLPSKPGKLRIGNYEIQLRIPDIERMRFLH